jgi:5'-nucleotidase/UDP-sugar diphosphatase
VFLERMAEAKFPLFGANLRRADGSPVPGHQDRSIREFDGVKIGITGIAYENSARLSSPEDLKFLPAIRTTGEQAGKLRQEGADFVCAVLHCDRGDAFLLQFSRTAELVLTGHTHDLFINYDDETAIVESSFDAHFVTAIDVEIAVTEENGRRTTRWSPRFRVIDSADVTPDPEMAAAVAAFEEDFSREAGATIAVTAVELDSRNATVRTREAAIGNLFADAMRLSMRADAAVINGGGIRAGRVYPAGTPISRRDILAELPFNNRVVAVEIAGRDLLRAIENGLAQLPVAAGRFPQVSGMRIVFDPARKPRERVLSIDVAGAPLDLDRRYRVAILDFLARGGDDYSMFREATRITPDADSPLLANEIMAYLRDRKTVSPQVDGRLIAR